MLVHTHRPAFIFALNTGSITERQIVETVFLRSRIKTLTGSWEGKEEQSYFVVTSLEDTDHDLELVRKLCHKHDQDAFLFLDNQRSAFLYSKDNGYTAFKHLGRFLPVSEATAKKQKAKTSTSNVWLLILLLLCGAMRAVMGS